MMRTPNLNGIARLFQIPILCIVIGVLIFIFLRLFFFSLEHGAASDGMESTLRLEQEGLTSLEIFVNESIKNCHMSVTDFERLVHIHYGAKIHWEEDGRGFAARGLRVTKKDSCIEEIRFAY